MTTATLTKPMGEWFTQLDAEIQADITEMVNENGYPLDDIQDFIETHGAKAYVAGHYATWCELNETFNNEIIEAFVEEFGINNIDSFEDSYCGTYRNGAEYAQELVEGGWSHGFDNIPSFVEIDWEATWENLSQDYTEIDGHIFNNHF